MPKSVYPDFIAEFFSEIEAEVKISELPRLSKEVKLELTSVKVINYCNCRCIQFIKRNGHNCPSCEQVARAERLGRGKDSPGAKVECGSKFPAFSGSRTDATRSDVLGGGESVIAVVPTGSVHVPYRRTTRLWESHKGHLACFGPLE